VTIECDELWSFIKVKGHQQWIWLALEQPTREIVREIVGVARGERSERTAKQLWDSLPGVYRQCAVSHTDFGAAYLAVLPVTRHRTHNQLGQTNHIKRLNCTLRQRISRLVRKSFRFQKNA
jgi:insertion element IS1 protein InsB